MSGHLTGGNPVSSSLDPLSERVQVGQIPCVKVNFKKKTIAVQDNHSHASMEGSK